MLEKYYATDELDLIKVIQIIEQENIEVTSVSRIRYSYGACGGGFRGVYQAHYFLGIRISSIEPVRDADGHNVTVGCDETYTR